MRERKKQSKVSILRQTFRVLAPTHRNHSAAVGPDRPTLDTVPGGKTEGRKTCNHFALLSQSPPPSNESAFQVRRQGAVCTHLPDTNALWWGFSAWEKVVYCFDRLTLQSGWLGTFVSFVVVEHFCPPFLSLSCFPPCPLSLLPFLVRWFILSFG